MEWPDILGLPWLAARLNLPKRKIGLESIGVVALEENAEGEIAALRMDHALRASGSHSTDHLRP